MPFHEKDQGSINSNGIGMKFSRNVLHVNMHQLTVSLIFNLMSHFQDGGHDVISRIKVLPSAESIRSILPAPMQ